jgi:DeoR family transcriptional regulator, fructose operon transcriptional repressor
MTTESLSQLIPEDRRRVIASVVRDRGSVRGRDLVEMLGVTDETIRRDLLHLARSGQIQRSRGGAVSVQPQDEASTAVRLREHAAEKLAIGALAADLVADGSRVILDSGTTTLCLARALRAKRDLTVVTTAVTHAVELLDVPGTTVVMTGGVIRPLTYGASGDLAVATLREVRVDIVFLAIHSVSVEGGLTYPSYEEVEAKRAMIAAGSRVILLADHSKFGREALVKVAPLTALDTIVTTPGVDPADLEHIRDLGIEILEAPVDVDLAAASA